MHVSSSETHNNSLLGLTYPNYRRKYVFPNKISFFLSKVESYLFSRPKTSKHYLIVLFNNYLHSAYYMPDIVLRACKYINPHTINIIILKTII